MKRLSVLSIATAAVLFAAACGSSTPTAPTPTQPTFTAALLPNNEVPPATGAESSGSGTMTITLDTTKDAAGNVTAATASFAGTFSGFPAGTTLTGAHIHQAAAGVSGSIVVPLSISPGEIVFTTGSGTLNKSGVSIDAAVAQAMLTNPAGFYFNIHTAAHPSGVARGQLVSTG